MSIESQQPIEEELINKKILFVVSVGHFFLSHRLDLAKNLANLGAEIRVACRLDDSQKNIESHGFKAYNISFDRVGINPLNEWKTIKDLQRLIAEIQPDIIHGFAHKAILYSDQAVRWSGSNIPIIGTVTGMGYVYTSQSIKARLLRPLVSFFLKRFIHHPNHQLITQNNDDQADLNELAGTKSGAEREQQQVSCIGGSGLDSEYYHPKFNKASTKSSAQKQEYIVVCLSRLLISKGLFELAEATLLLQKMGVPVKVIAYGERDDNPQSLTLGDVKKLEQRCGIQFAGHCDDPREALMTADIAVLASYREGLPRFLLEAAAMGLPLIATDVRGSRDICKPNRSGILVPSHDIKSLANAVEELCLNDDLRTELAQGARQLVEQKFSAEQITKEHVHFYKTLLKGHYD